MACLDADLLPPSDLCIVPDTGDELLARSLVGDDGRLSDQERSGRLSTLSVILNHDIGGDVVLGVAVPSHRGQDDAMSELGGTNADRMEELAIGGRHAVQCRGWKSRMLDILHRTELLFILSTSCGRLSFWRLCRSTRRRGEYVFVVDAHKLDSLEPRNQ